MVRTHRAAPGIVTLCMEVVESEAYPGGYGVTEEEGCAV